MDILRYIAKRPIRSGLTILQAALGVAIVAALLSILVSVGRDSRNLTERFGGIVVTECRRDLPNKGVWATPPLITKELVDSIRDDVPAIETIIPVQGVWQVELVVDEKKYMALGSVAMGHGVSGLNLLHLEAGSYFTADDIEQGNRVVMVTPSVIRRLWGAGDISSFIGKGLRLAIPSHTGEGTALYSDYRIVGVYDVDFNVTGPFGELDKANLVFPLGLPPQPRGYTASGVDSPAAVVKARKGQSGILTRQLATYSRQRLKREGAYLHTTSTAGSLAKRMRIVRNNAALLGVMGIVSMLTVSIGILCNMMVGTVERTREVGLRRALGASRRGIVRLFAMESLILALIGGIIGIGFAAFLGGRITEIVIGMDWVAGVHRYNGLEPLAVLASLALSAVTGYLSSLYPAIQIAGIQPSEAIKES